MDLVWFQSLKWVEDHVMRGSLYIAFGKPNLFNESFSISHPDLETIQGRLELLETLLCNRFIILPRN
jgi:RecG-like helicase